MLSFPKNKQAPSKDIPCTKLTLPNAKRKNRPSLAFCSACFLLGILVNLGLHLQNLRDPNILAPPNDLDNWYLYTTGTAQATLRREGSKLVIQVSGVDGNTQHVKCFQRGIDLKEGKVYTLRFHARSDVPRDMRVEACMDQPDYHSVGLSQIAPVLANWQTFSYTFRATQVLDSDTCIPRFSVGNKNGMIWLENISVREVKPTR